MVPGVTYEDTISLALGLSQHCPTVTATLSVQATAGHIVIKQEHDVLEVMKLHATKQEMFDFSVEMMKMKEF